MNSPTTASALLLLSRPETRGSIFIAFPEPAWPARQISINRNDPMTRSLTQRFDAAFSIIAMFGLLSPLALASVMFVVTSH